MRHYFALKNTKGWVGLQNWQIFGVAFFLLDCYIR